MSVAWVSAGVAIYSAYSASQAQEDAANQATEGNRNAQALQDRQFQQTRADNAGVRARGEAAGNRLAQLMGVGPASSGAAPVSRNALRRQLLDEYRTTGGFSRAQLPLTPAAGGGTSDARARAMGAAAFDQNGRMSMAGDYNGVSAAQAGVQAGAQAGAQAGVQAASSGGTSDARARANGEFGATPMAQAGRAVPDSMGALSLPGTPRAPQQTFDAGDVDNEALNVELDRRMAAQGDAGELDRNFDTADLYNDPLYNQFSRGIAQDDRRDTERVNTAGANYDSMNRRFNAGDLQADPVFNRLVDPQALAAAGSNFSNTNFERDPGYQFRMQQGNDQVQNSAAARGGLLSGAAMQAMQRFSQGFASNEFGQASDRFNNNRAFVAGQLDNSSTRFNNDRGYAAANYGNQQNLRNANRGFASSQGDAAYNRYNNNTTQRFNRLSALAGAGQTATNNVNAAGAANAQQQGALAQDTAQARSAATIGRANSINQGLLGVIRPFQERALADQR